MAHTTDVLRLARGKFDTGAVRYFYQVVRDGDARLGQAEVFVSDRAGANVPDDLKTQRCVVQVPFAPTTHSADGVPTGRDPTQVVAVNALYEKLEALDP